MNTHKKLEPDDPFGPMLLASLFRLTVDDMTQAIKRNSTYRELAAVQWATLLARRAREWKPELRCDCYPWEGFHATDCGAYK